MEARPQRRTKAGRLVSTITREELESCFHMPSEQACRHLGVGLTILKRVCRRFGIPRWPYNRQGRHQAEDGSADSSGLHATGMAASNAGTQGMAPPPAFGAALPQPVTGQQQQQPYTAPLPSFGATPQPPYGPPAMPLPGLQGFGQPPPAPLPPPPPQQQQPAQMDWQQTLQTVLSSLLPQQPPQPVAPAPPPPPQPSLGSVLGSILGGAAGASQWSDGTHFAPPPPQAKLPMGQGALTLAAVQQLASLLQQQQTAAPQQLQAPQAQQVQHLLRQVQQPQLEQQVQQPQLELQQVQQQDTQQAQLQQTQQQQAQQQHAQQQQEQPPLDGFAAFAPVAQALVSAPSVASAGAVAASGAASGGAPARQEAQNPALVRRAPGDDSSYNQLAPAVQQSGLEDAAGATTDTGGSGPGDASVGPASEAQPQQPGSELPTEELVRQVAAALPDLTHTAALLRKAAEQLQAHLAAQRLLQGEAAALAAQLPGARVLAGPNAEVAELCVTTLLGLLDGVGKSPRSGAAAGEAAAAQPGPEPFAPAAAPQDELVGTAPAGAGLPSAVPRG